MTNRVSSYSALSGADPAFDVLVDRLIARQNAGEIVDWSAIAREHPEHAERLTSMAVALEALDDVFGTAEAATLGALRRLGKEDLLRGALGDFHIVREVGRGGMGVVYEAEQVSLNRRVALKVLPLAATIDPRQLQRFRHEARAAGLLHHAHIVPVYGVGCERGIHYYAMQLIDGCSLAAVIGEWRALAESTAQPKRESCVSPSIAHWPASALHQDPNTRTERPQNGRPSPLAREGLGERGSREGRPQELATRDPLITGETNPSLPATVGGTATNAHPQRSFRRIAELVAQAADALEYAHAMGVVHRDIKPANLLLDGRGHVWITDFGLARLGEGPGLTVSGDLLGTLKYMSPEQALAGHGLVDHRTDVYSLGATLYELLTLHSAVEGASKEEILRHLAFLEPVSPRKLDRSIPVALETLTLKALAKDLRERYATAQALADDLRRWLDNRPIVARQPGPLQRLRKWSYRHRPLVIGIATFWTLAFASLVVAVVGYGIKKGELAEARTRFAEERAKSERKIARKLRQVLIDRAETIHLARQPGYRKRAFADLEQAIALPPADPEEETLRIRTTAVACLGDPVGLDQVADVKAVRRRATPDLPSAFSELAGKARNGGTFALSPRGDKIATASRDGRVTVYDSNAKPTWEKESPLGGVYALALGDNDTVLVAGCEQGFVVWNLSSQDQWDARVGNVFSVALSPTADNLAVAGRQFALWSLAAKRPIASWPIPEPGAGVEFSVDGRVHFEAGAGVEFSTDGRVLLAVAKGTPVAGWPVSDTPERRVLDGHKGGVPAVAFSPDGRHLVSASKDRTVRIWDAFTGELLRTLTGHSGEIESAAFSVDGSLLATGDLTGTVKLWSSRSGEPLCETSPGAVSGQVWRLQFSPGGEYLAAAGMSVVAWTVRTAAHRLELAPLCTVATTPDTLGAIDLAIRPGGAELIYLDRRGGVFSYDLARADNPRLIGNARVALRSLHFTPTGDRFGFVTTRGTLGLWNGSRMTSGAAMDKTPQGVASGKVAINDSADTRRPGGNIAMSADGRWVAVAGAERSIKIADLLSGQEVFTLPPEPGEVWSLAWAPEGTKLAVGTADGGVVIWDLACVRARLAELGIESPSLAPTGKIRIETPIKDFNRAVRLNLLREEAERARRRAADARLAGDASAERDHLTAALELAERLAQAEPEAYGHRERLAWIHVALARVLSRLGDAAGALAHLDTEAELLKRLALADPQSADYRRLRGQALTARADILDRTGRRSEALQTARQAMSVRAELAADPGTPNDREQLAVVYNNLGYHLSRVRQTAEAERWYKTALRQRDELAHDEPATAESVGFRHSRGGTLHNYGVLRAQAGDSEAAARLLREAMTIRNRLADDFPTNPNHASDAGRTLDWLGGMLRNLGELEESAMRMRQAVDRQEAALRMRPKDLVIRELCWKHHAELAMTLLKIGRHADAATAAREIPRLDHDNPAALLRAASLIAGCSALASRSAAPWALGLIQARAYGDEAIALARQAISHGLENARARLARKEFDPVRERDEFRALLDELPVPNQ